jgi:hypothetical protein
VWVERMEVFKAFKMLGYKTTKSLNQICSEKKYI